MYIQHGLFDTKLKIASDFEIMFRFIHEKKITPYFINDFLVVQRDGGESTKSYKNRFKGNIEIFRVVSKKLIF